MSQTESISATVEIDTRIYRLTAVKKAAYKFGDRCHVLIEPLAESAVRIILKPKRLLDSPTRLAGEFQNELLDQELRQIIDVRRLEQHIGGAADPEPGDGG